MKQKKSNLICVAIFGSTGVTAGAFGAHALKQKVESGILSQSQLSAWDTASKYQLIHTIALLFLILAAERIQSKWITASKILFTTGILLFSGSLYLLILSALAGWHLTFLGPLTPLGGLTLIAGWLCMGFFSLEKKQVH